MRPPVFPAVFLYKNLKDNFFQLCYNKNIPNRKERYL